MNCRESAAIMAQIDAMRPEFRALVHEYGFVMVAGMINDGYDDPLALREALETWRERRQKQWLATDFVTMKATVSNVNAALCHAGA